MPENKKQHYIPQFYLKNFSDDGNHINVYHLESGTDFLSPIKSTCQSKYFYGKDTEFEKALSDIERYQADVIKKIVENQSVTCLSKDEIFTLLTFFTLQITRTKEAKIIADNFTNLISEKIFKPMMNARAVSDGKPPRYFDSIRIENPEYYKFIMGSSLTGTWGITDLKPILIVNNTGTPFISSDSPVVKNNYFRIKNDNLTGMQSPGLQMFCPLSDKLLLLLIHEDAYVILGESNSIINLTNESDIDNINRLHLLNALDIILFINSKDVKYIQRLQLETVKIKTKKQYVIDSIKKTSNPDGGKEILHIHSEGINYGIHISVIKMNHDYNRKFKRQCELTLKDSPVVQPYRSKVLIDKMHSEFERFTKKSKSTVNGSSL
ncbi:MAG: DUF4238 domain-containing protein [Candidatus Pacebacteria bacterium]|nr:DUF4238 domain-containing protein [Candidatus Paceibacterota bacterium]